MVAAQSAFWIRWIRATSGGDSGMEKRFSELQKYQTFIESVNMGEEYLSDDKLEKIKEDSTPADYEDIQGAIDELQTEADELEIQLEDRLSGISLFGWLAKLLIN